MGVGWPTRGSQLLAGARLSVSGPALFHENASKFAPRQRHRVSSVYRAPQPKRSVAERIDYQGWQRDEEQRRSDRAGERCAAESDRSRAYNIVDLGFVLGVPVDEGVAHITITATSRGCPAASFLKEGAAKSACTVPGIGSVDVTMTFDPPWRPAMMSSDAKALLGFAEVN